MGNREESDRIAIEKKIEKHLPALMIPNPTSGKDPEYQRVRYKLKTNPKKRKLAVGKIAEVLLGLDAIEDSDL